MRQVFYADIVNHLAELAVHPIVRSRAGSIKAPVIRATYSNSLFDSAVYNWYFNEDLIYFFQVEEHL